MKNKLFSVWLLLTSLLLGTSFFPNSIFAQDNNQIDNSCTISVNGVNAITSLDDNAEPSREAIPIAPAGSQEGGQYAQFPVTVTLGGDAVTDLNDCAPPNTSLQLATLTGAFNRWENAVLTRTTGATYTSSFDVYGNFSEDYIVAIDVETPSNVTSCIPAPMPLCQRAYIRLRPTIIENETDGCTASVEELHQWFNFEEDECSVNTPMSFNIDQDYISQLLTSCNADIAKAEIYSADTGEKVGNSNTTSGTTDLTLTYNNPEAGNFYVKFIVMSSGDNCIVDPASCVVLTSNIDYTVSNEVRGGVSCTQVDTSEIDVQAYQLCNQIPEGTGQRDSCNTCYNNEGIWTAIGCVPQNPAQAIGVLIRIGLNIAGGVALIMILVAGFMFTTSQGNPKRTDEAKEMMQSAVIGLFFIIFSVTILQFIGSDLLKIPGFGGN